MPQTVRQILTAVKAVLALTVILGVIYPLVMLGVGQLGLHRQARGSLITSDGQVVASALIGQSFEGEQWFQPRPSAGDYDALASGGTNAGPNDGELAAAVAARRRDIAARDGVAAQDVPPDAITSSGSGLDPFISPGYAHQQVQRVARARSMAADRVQALVAEHTQGRASGFLGQPRVNVVELNLALRRLS